MNIVIGMQVLFVVGKAKCPKLTIYTVLCIVADRLCELRARSRGTSWGGQAQECKKFLGTHNMEDQVPETAAVDQLKVSQHAQSVTTCSGSKPGMLFRLLGSIAIILAIKTRANQEQLYYRS